MACAPCVAGAARRHHHVQGSDHPQGGPLHRSHAQLQIPPGISRRTEMVPKGLKRFLCLGRRPGASCALLFIESSSHAHQTHVLLKQRGRCRGPNVCALLALCSSGARAGVVGARGALWQRRGAEYAQRCAVGRPSRHPSTAALSLLSLQRRLDIHHSSLLQVVLRWHPASSPRYRLLRKVACQAS